VAVVEIVRPEFLPPKLVVSYLLAAAHGIVNKAVMNEPVLRKPIAHGLSGPIAVQGSVLEMPIGELIVGVQLMLVRQLMVARGMDGMLSMVC
jgi:hypothetical protein